MKTRYKILLVFVLSVGTVAALYFLQDKPAKNDFKRERIHTAKKLQVLDLTYNSYFISGLSAERIYLGNKAAPVVLFSCSYSLTDVRSERLPFNPKQAINWRLARMQVDSPAVYLAEYDTPAFVSAMMPFGKEQTHNLNGLRFDLVQVLSPNSLIVNGFDPVSKQKALQKVTLQPPRKLQGFYCHENQQDGSFSIDGFISCNKEKGMVLFTYYYRNQFVCLDTNLNVLYQGKTIDSNSRAKIKIAEITKDGRKVRTMAAPPLLVNKRGYSSGNYLYIHAALIARNEDPATFNAHAVIDVYAINSRKYSHSIYLPKHKDEPLTDFAVKGNVLIAVYGRYLVSYGV